ELREKGRVNEGGRCERRPRPDEVVERLGRLEARAEAEDRVTLVGDERCRKDEAENIGPAVRRVRDHDPPIRVSNEDLRTWYVIERSPDNRDVSGDRQQAEGRDHGGIAVLLERRDDRVPALGRRPGAMDEDNRGTRPGTVGVSCRREDRNGQDDGKDAHEPMAPWPDRIANGGLSRRSEGGLHQETSMDQ